MAERKRVDPTRAKRDINFDTYVAPKEGTRINWFEQGKVITDAFSNVAKDRTQRKEALQTEYDTALTEINEIENYDDQTMQTMAIDGVNNSANVMYDAKQRLENGKMRPADYSKFVNNIRAGQTMFRRLAGEWQADFKRYTNRMQGADGFEQSSTLEQYIGKRMESFGNLKGMQIVTNPETGNLAFARFQDGVLLTGADDLISMQRMTAISKQEINEVNVGDEIKGVVAEIGDMITAANNTEDGMGNRGTMTLEDFMQKPEAEQILNDKAGSVLKDNNSIGSVLADNDVQNEYGESYEAGTQIDFDDWLERNSDKTPEENPIIIMGYRENGVNIVPEITDRQKEAAREFLIRGYKGALDYKETLKPDDYHRPRAPQPSAASLANKNKDDAKSSKLGDYITMLTDVDPVKREAIEKTLRTTRNDAIDKFNAKVSNDEDKLPLITNITKGSETKRPATKKDVAEALALDKDSKLIEGDEVTDITNRKITLSDGKTIEIQGTFTEQTRILEAVYDPDNQLTTDDIENLAKGRGFNLKTEITSTGDSGKTSKAAYATPNYQTDLQIKGKSSAMSAKDYMDAEYGYGSGAEFNSTVDTTEGIGEGMINLINASLDPAMLAEFNKTPGQELSMTFETGVGQDSVTFNFGGESLTIGGSDGDIFKKDLYGGNGYELWEKIQTKLLNPAIKKLNKSRTDGGSNYELD
tara:strand:- start:130 stop:2226 length:2097 start_codon:yes stop_codon:yes gene_type:complete